MPSVNISGVGVVNFPNTMSAEDITRVIETEILPGAQRKPTDRTMGEAITDTYAKLKSGIGGSLQIPDQILSVISGNYEKPGEETGLAAVGKEMKAEAEANLSPGYKAREASRAAKIAEAEKKGQIDAFTTAFSETVRDPALITGFIAEQAPQLIPSLGAARLIKPLAGTAAAVRGAVGTGAVQQGADISAGTYEQIYKELVGKGATEPEAAGAALGYARVTGASAAVISLLAQRLPGAKAIEEAFAGKTGSLGRALGAARGALGEAVSEVAEETPAKLLQNLALQQVAPETLLTGGLGEIAALAAIGGVGLGGAAGLLQRQASREEAPPAAKPRPSQFAPTPEPEVPPSTPPVGGRPEAPWMPGAPPSTTVEPEPTPETRRPEYAPPSEEAVQAMGSYWEGKPEDFGLSFADIQNRNRARPAAIQQMTNITANPNYNRLSESKDFGAGAPVVISDTQINPKYLGRIDMVSATDGTEIPIQYAVMDVKSITPSNLADGTIVPEYADPSFQGIRPVAGNGRIAGLQRSYQTGTNGNYTQSFINDPGHGISPEAIQDFEQPVLVRIMPKSFLTPDIADKSNVPGQLAMSPTEQAKIDMKRFDLQGIEFLADGSPSLRSLRQFLAAMPKEEQAQLMNAQGQPNPLSKIRLSNALFARAYENDGLIDLFAEATDPEAQQILRGMAIAAPAMSNLSGAGEYDIRAFVTKAAELAVNARRQGVDLATYASQGDIEMDPLTQEIVSMFANNKNAPRRIGDSLTTLAAEAQKAYDQTQGGPDLFGNEPVGRPLEEIFAGLRGEPTTTVPIVEEIPERVEFEIDKDPAVIFKEIKGMSLPKLTQWLIDNAPNSAAKAIAEKMLVRIKEYDQRGVSMSMRILNGANRSKNAFGQSKVLYGNQGIRFEVLFNGVDSKGVADRSTGTTYKTIMHELLHVATQPQLYLLPKSAPEIQEMERLLALINNQINKDVATGKDHPFIKTMLQVKDAKPKSWNKFGPMKNIAEVLTWGLTNFEYQSYIAQIQVAPKQSAFTQFVDVLRNLLGLNPQYQTALEQVAAISEEILSEAAVDIAAMTERAGTFLGTRTGPSTGSAPSEGTFESEMEMPQLYEDIPNQDWLQGKINYSISKGRNTFGVPHMSSITGYFNKPVQVSTRVLVKLKGERGEQQNKREASLDYIRKNWAKVSKNPIYVEVAYNGEAWVSEGNHRIMVAAEKSIDYLPVEIKYFDGGQLRNGPLSPSRISSLEEGFFESEMEMPEFIRKGVEKVTKKGGITPEQGFGHVDPDYQKKLGQFFSPEGKTFADKMDTYKDRTFQRLAQGIADQFRTIKDYSPLAYMKARLSKTIDGALEGLTFFGEVKLTDGALDIKQGTKSLVDILKPIGDEVNSFLIWRAMSRDFNIVQKSKRTEEEIDRVKSLVERLKNLKTDASQTFDKELKNIISDASLTAEEKQIRIIEMRKSVDNFKRKVDSQIKDYRDNITKLKDTIKIPSINPEVVAQRNELAKGKIGTESRLEVYNRISKELTKLNKSVLDVAVEKGLIDNKAYGTFLQDVYFIPFYKMVEDGQVDNIRTAAGLSNQYFSKALKGGEKPFGDLMENMLRNWSHILSASMKNDAAVETMMAATEAGAAFPNLRKKYDWMDGEVYSAKTGEILAAEEIDGVNYKDGEIRPGIFTSDGKGLVKVMYKGFPAYFEVIDPLLVESVMAIGYMGPKSKFLDVARDFKNILQYGITISPPFKARNLVRDSVQSAAVSEIGLNIGKNAYTGFNASNKKNPDYISALAGGAIFNYGSLYEGDQAKLVKMLIKEGVPASSILNSASKITNGLSKAFKAYQDFGNKSESANRMALYMKLKEKGYSHLEASYKARDLLDFSMQGAWPAVRLVTQVVPFLNARTQGLYKLGRDGVMPTSRVIYNSITGKPIEATDKQKAQQFSIVTSATVLASLMLYLAFKDDDEWKKREQWDRDNFWWFKLPGMDQALRIPKPFEIGAFGTLAERLAEQMFDEGAEGKVFEQSMKRMLTDTFAVNLPQMFKPLVDLYANKDSFTGAPIETAGMERLSKAERVATNTSPLAKAVSAVSNVFLPESTEVSPVQVDYAIKAYFGWLGATISSSSHYAVMPFSKSAYPDHNWTETMSLGFIKSLPTAQSGYVTSFYENMKIIEQANADMRHYAEIGESGKMQQIMEEKGDKIALAKFYDKVSKDMSKIHQVQHVIINDETMDGAQKKEEIDRLKILIGELAKQAEDIRKSMRK